MSKTELVVLRAVTVNGSCISPKKVRMAYLKERPCNNNLQAQPALSTQSLPAIPSSLLHLSDQHHSATHARLSRKLSTPGVAIQPITYLVQS